VNKHQETVTNWSLRHQVYKSRRTNSITDLKQSYQTEKD